MVAVPEASAVFSVHFDGPIVKNHHVSLRVMSRTYEHMQRAIDRAYLVEKYGAVYKHARLKAEDYPETEFIALYPREGGIILDAIRRAGGGAIIDRIADALTEPFERAVQGGLDEAVGIRDQLAQRRRYLRQHGDDGVPSLQGLIETRPAGWERAYSNRSIVKEVDQLVAQVAAEEVDGSTLDVTLNGDNSRATFGFTSGVARRFHEIVALRELGPVVVVNAKIRQLDRGNNFANPKAKILNIDSGREVILHLEGEDDFIALHPYHTAEHIRIFASPYIEAGGFDVRGGDLFFVAVAN